MTFKEELIKGFKSAAVCMLPLFILNFWVFLCLGVLCAACIPINPSGAFGLFALGVYDFLIASLMLFLCKKAKEWKNA